MNWLKRLFRKNKPVDELTLIQRQEHLEEREAFLNKMKEAIEFEKESMLGKDNLDIKRNILLPPMKKKWEAEAKKLDSERAKIMNSVPNVYYSLDSNRLEIENQIAIIKNKPSNMGNQNLLIHWEARLQQLLEIMEVIDRERIYDKKIIIPSVH